MIAKIYCLEDPRKEISADKHIRYVGMTETTLNERLSNHCSEKRNNHKNNWITSLKKLGLKPIINCIDEVPTSEWKFWEQHYISLFKSWGFDLLNIKLGGDGGGKQTEETKRKIRATLMGHKVSEETKLKQRKPRSAESKINMSKGAIGKKHSKETKDKLSKALIGNTRTLGLTWKWKKNK